LITALEKIAGGGIHLSEEVLEEMLKARNRAGRSVQRICYPLVKELLRKSKEYFQTKANSLIGLIKYAY